MIFITLLLIALATEAMVEIVVASTLFLPFRRIVYFVIGWERLCGYCLSFWFAAFFWIMKDDFFCNLLIMSLCAHRISNLLHEGFVRWFKRTPNVSVNSVYFKKQA